MVALTAIGEVMAWILAAYLFLIVLCLPLMFWLCARAERVEERDEFTGDFYAWLSTVPTADDCPERELC